MKILCDSGSAWIAYSPLKGRKIFRMTFELDQMINEEILKKAVKDFSQRLPSFFVNIKRTVFHDYYICVSNYNIVEKYPGFGSKSIPLFDTDKPIFRILFKENQIMIEFDHFLTDGHGMIDFMRSLITHYYELHGETSEKCNGIYYVCDKECKSEYNDNYILCKEDFNFKSAYLRDPLNEVEINYGDYQKYCYSVIWKLKVNDVICIAKQNNASVTEFWAAVILYVFFKVYKPEKNKEMCINIPIDLRNITGVTTLRNSSDTITIGVKLVSDEAENFYEILELVKGQIKKRTQPELIKKRIEEGILFTKNPLFNILPQCLKLPIFVKRYYQLHGKSVSSISNMGLVKLPNEISNHVKACYVTALTNMKKEQVAFYCMSTSQTCVVSASFGCEEHKVIDCFTSVLNEIGLEYAYNKIS